MGWLEITMIVLVVVALLGFIVAAQWQGWQRIPTLLTSLGVFGGAIAIMLVLMVLRGEGCL